VREHPIRRHLPRTDLRRGFLDAGGLANGKPLKSMPLVDASREGSIGDSIWDAPFPINETARLD